MHEIGPGRCTLRGNPNELETAEHLLANCDVTSTDILAARRATTAGQHLVDGYIWTLFSLGNCPISDLQCCVALVDTIYHRTVQAQVILNEIRNTSSSSQEENALNQ